MAVEATEEAPQRTLEAFAYRQVVALMMGPPGIEPGTSSMSRKRSPAELWALACFGEVSGHGRARTCAKT